MGYRLSIECDGNPDLHYYGTKLYGYVKDESKLLSYEYLKRIGKLDEIVNLDVNNFETVEDIKWDYCFDCNFTLTAEQFSTFIGLYAQDLCDKYGSVVSFVFLKELIPIIAEPGDKMIEWG